MSDTVATTQLTDNERIALAREVAADSFHVGEDLIKYECGECGERGDVEGVRVGRLREAVQHGWDAAMEYVENNRRNRNCPRCGEWFSSAVVHVCKSEEERGYPSFSNGGMSLG